MHTLRISHLNMPTSMNLLNSVIERGRNISTLLQQYLGDSDVKIQAYDIRSSDIFANGHFDFYYTSWNTLSCQLPLFVVEAFYTQILAKIMPYFMS